MNAQETIFMMSMYLMIAFMLSMMVFYSSRTLLFGIALPAEAVQDAAVQAIRRNYALLTGGAGGVIGVACFAVTRLQPAGRSIQCWIAAIVLVILVSVFLIRVSRISAQRLKAARGWQIVVQTKRAASLAVGRTHRLALSAWWYSAQVAVMALCVIIAVARWNAIPQSFATHMGPNGYPDHYTSKSVFTVFMMNFVQALMIVLFIGYNLMISRSRTSLDPHDREGSLRKQAKLKKLHSFAAWGVSLLGIANLGLLQAVTLYGWKLELLFRCNIAFVAALFLALIGVLLYQRFRGLDQLRDFPSEADRHWKWLGSIYANPEDPALFVPDRYGLGWTINMANSLGKVIAAATLAVLVGAILVPLFGI